MVRGQKDSIWSEQQFRPTKVEWVHKISVCKVQNEIYVYLK